ncbi:hypothetical protein [Methanobrevibacter sp.]|uniref:hypothetical protein n=1 Tax=Methanobrevibacter sp. TaxID=66852 RepID=UPI0025D01CE4|nr:hypothetical protein [Methanobrevibacter sp.]MBQ2962857.1 hypothetical protein [Methanobrevibacter sp.]
MTELKNTLISAIFGAIITNITNLIISLLFSTDKNLFIFDQLYLNFINHWIIFLLIFLITFTIAFIRLKMIEKPPYLYIPINDFEKRYSLLVRNNKKLFWEVHIEELFAMVYKRNYHFYVGDPICPNELEDNTLCLTELQIKDYGLFYLESCVNCRKNYIRFSNFDKERHEVQLKIDALIKRNISKINSANDLFSLLKKNWDL